MLCSAVQCSARALVSSRRPTRLALHFPFRPRRSSGGGGGMSSTTIHLLSCLVQFTRDCISSSPFLLSSFFFLFSSSFDFFELEEMRCFITGDRDPFLFLFFPCPFSFVFFQFRSVQFNSVQFFFFFFFFVSPVKTAHPHLTVDSLPILHRRRLLLFLLPCSKQNEHLLLAPHTHTHTHTVGCGNKARGCDSPRAFLLLLLLSVCGGVSIRPAAPAV